MMEVILEFLVIKIIMPLTVVIAALGVIGIPVVFIVALASPRSPTFELNVSEWLCTLDRKRVNTSMVLVGKIMVPSTTNSIECLQWTKKESR